VGIPLIKCLIASSHRDPYSICHPLNGWSIKFYRSENIPVSSPSSFEGIFYAIVVLSSSSWQWKSKHSLWKRKQWWQGTIENGRRRSNRFSLSSFRAAVVVDGGCACGNRIFTSVKNPNCLERMNSLGMTTLRHSWRHVDYLGNSIFKYKLLRSTIQITWNSG